MFAFVGMPDRPRAKDSGLKPQQQPFLFEAYPCHDGFELYFHFWPQPAAGFEARNNASNTLVMCLQLLPRYSHGQDPEIRYYFCNLQCAKRGAFKCSRARFCRKFRVVFSSISKNRIASRSRKPGLCLYSWSELFVVTLCTYSLFFYFSRQCCNLTPHGPINTNVSNSNHSIAQSAPLMPSCF